MNEDLNICCFIIIISMMVLIIYKEFCIRPDNHKYDKLYLFKSTRERMLGQQTRSSFSEFAYKPNSINVMGDFVFLSNAGKPINSNTPNGALKRMGYQDKQTLHGFRGIYRSLIDTHQVEHNINYDVKKRFLDHHDNNKVELAYNHRAEFFEQMKPLVEWWSCYLINLKNEL